MENKMNKRARKSSAFISDAAKYVTGATCFLKKTLANNGEFELENLIQI